MFNGNYISIKSILGTIVNYPFVEGIAKEDIALYLAEFLRKVGAPISFLDKIDTIDILNNKGDLPNDILYIRGTRVACDGLILSNNSTYNCDNKQGYISLKYASDIYHTGYHCTDTGDELDMNADFTYSLNGGRIFTSFKEGCIEMSYKGLMVDDQGFPMIPDDVKVIEALKYYILWKYAEPAYYRKDVPRDIYDDIKTQYAFYVGAAQNSLNMPSPDQMQTLQNGLIRLIRNTQWHEEGWRNFTKKEKMTGVNRSRSQSNRYNR